MSIENKLKDLGLTLPKSLSPQASYLPAKQTGNLLFVSGQAPILDNGFIYTGKVGTQVSIEDATEAARLCVMNLLATVKSQIDTLDNITNIVKLQVFVNSEVGFTKQHIVANGASKLLFDIFGDKGMHARTAVGTNQLPLDIIIEIEAIIEVDTDL